MDEQEKASDATTQQEGSVPPSRGDGSGGSSGNASPANGRPENVADLVMGVTLTDDWFAANRRGNRFYVVNLSNVIAAIGLSATKSSSYFVDANKVIEDKTKWKQQFNFEYKSSHTQIFPKNALNGQAPQTAKLFGIAATIIVAMELAAKVLRPEYNVYDHLRILPAHFFVDRFNGERLRTLIAQFDNLSVSERVAKFGATAAGQSFDSVCLDAIEQLNGRLLPQLADGYCVTQHTAEKLVEFIRSKFPSELHVGPVRSSGENATNLGLGYKNAAPDFRPPRTIPQAQLPLCAMAPGLGS